MAKFKLHKIFSEKSIKEYLLEGLNNSENGYNSSDPPQEILIKVPWINNLIMN